MIDKVIAKMKAEGATSASIAEIYRCLSGCVSGKKLIAVALKHRPILCAGFCGMSECSDGEFRLPCRGCNYLTI